MGGVGSQRINSIVLRCIRHMFESYICGLDTVSPSDPPVAGGCLVPTVWWGFDLGESEAGLCVALFTMGRNQVRGPASRPTPES